MVFLEIVSVVDNLKNNFWKLIEKRKKKKIFASKFSDLQKKSILLIRKTMCFLFHFHSGQQLPIILPANTVSRIGIQVCCTMKIDACKMNSSYRIRSGLRSSHLCSTSGEWKKPARTQLEWKAAPLVGNLICRDYRKASNVPHKDVSSSLLSQTTSSWLIRNVQRKKLSWK